MQKSQIDQVTLIIATLAGAFALMQISGPFAWMSSIGGLALLIILLAFDREGYRTAFQSLAFSAVCGFCTAIAAGVIFQAMASHGEIHLANGQWATVYVPLTCAFATAIFFAIDLMRMSARKAAPIRVPRALGDTTVAGVAAAPLTYSAPPQPVVASQPAAAPLAQVAPEPAAAPAASAEPLRAPIEQPVYRPAPAVQSLHARPIQTLFGQRTEAPIAAPDNPASTSMFAGPAPAPPAPVPEAQPLQPGPAPIIPRTGKETMIYVSLLGEGLNVLRSVRAESLGRDFYRIVDDMPEGETWQFQPGQVVRCKKKNLSSGKAMVAMEEAPRAT